jgi:hypothetical protein
VIAVRTVRLAAALLAAALLLGALPAAAQPGMAPPPEPAPRLMPLQLELGLETVGGDGTAALGGRAAAAYVTALGDGERWLPFVGVGITGSWGTSWLRDPRAVDGWAGTSRYSLGPEARVGIVKNRDVGVLRFVAKGALVWADADGDLMGLAETGGGRGVRLGLAMASPGWLFRALDDRGDYSSRKEDAYAEVLALFVPTELELTVFHLDGQTRFGGTLGYSF